MTEAESRTEVYICRRKLDIPTGHIVDQVEISLKSQTESVDNLIRKAKEAVKI